MGIFGKVLAYSAGQPESIVCKTCGDTYRANIDKKFPYAVCGSCLEREQNSAARSGDNEMYSLIQWEFERRKNSRGWFRGSSYGFSKVIFLYNF